MEEPSTPAAGRNTPLKARLRSHHATPRSSPPLRPPPRAGCREVAEEAHTSKKQTAPKIPWRGGDGRNEDAGAAHTVRSLLHRSPRFAGRDPEHAIVIDDRTDEECITRDNQSSVLSFRRSPRFHRENKNSVTSLSPSNPQQISHNRPRNGSMKNVNPRSVRRSHRVSAANTSLSMKIFKEPLPLDQTSQDIPPQQRNADVSCERSEERAPLRRSPRFAGRDPDHLIVIDNGTNKECKSRKDQSPVTSLQRSPRFHSKENENSLMSLLPPKPQQISHNRKTQSASRKNENQGSVRKSHRIAAANALTRMKMLKERLSLAQTSQDIPPQQRNADVSCERNKEKELSNHREVLTKKRKRGSEGGYLTARRCYLKSRSMPPDCQEAAPRNDTTKVTCRKSGNNDSSMVQPNIGDMKQMNVKDSNEEPSGIEREGKEPFCGQDDWTEEQDMALQKAYFNARPSPHFWKKVSRMVPGRSATECFNRIHAELSTPTPIPRPRKCKPKFSPLGNFSLFDSELPNLLEPTVGKQRTYKKRNLAAQKMMKHLLQKQCLVDQSEGADHFSIFETSPSALQLSISFEDSPGTPRSHCRSGVSSSARKKSFSRLKSRQHEPSPAVLRPVKNPILHERYVNRLVRREFTKRPRRRAAGSKAADNMKAHPEMQAGNLKAAKNALISEATDFVSHFKKLQANSHANMVEDSEEDENDENDI